MQATCQSKCVQILQKYSSLPHWQWGDQASPPFQFSSGTSGLKTLQTSGHLSDQVRSIANLFLTFPLEHPSWGTQAQPPAASVGAASGGRPVPRPLPSLREPARGASWQSCWGGFSGGPERRVQSKAPQGPTAAESPGSVLSSLVPTGASWASQGLAISFLKIPRG